MKIRVLITILLFSINIFGKDSNKISKHFKFKDATKSNTAQKYRIKNLPKSSNKNNIIYTAKRMDKVKEVLKKDIIVTSWYRTPLLNKKVHGAKNSQHTTGFAVDFKINGAAKNIKTKLAKANISYDQLIYYPKQNRVHISFKKNKAKERHQYFVKR
ncbi:MAG: D-Ala-D-Ala carboxypeptidase family metallohydrolase [Cetobacterium sp.]